MHYLKQAIVHNYPPKIVKLSNHSDICNELAHCEIHFPKINYSGLCSLRNELSYLLLILTVSDILSIANFIFKNSKNKPFALFYKHYSKKKILIMYKLL